MNKDIADIEQIAQEIAEHDERTGTVLVGMHNELQEQKARLKDHEVAVATVAMNLSDQVKDVVSTAASRMEQALAPLVGIDAMSERASQSLADLNGSANRLGTEISKHTGSLSTLHQQFISDTRAAMKAGMDPLLLRMNDESQRFTRVLESSIDDLGKKYSDLMNIELKIHIEAVAKEFSAIRTLNEELRAQVRDHQTRVKDSIFQFGHEPGRVE